MRVLLALAAGLMVGAGEPPPCGDVQVDCLHTRWVVVRGSWGDEKVTAGSVRFLKGKRVEIRLQEGPRCRLVMRAGYKLDPITNLPKVPPTASKLLADDEITFHLVGSRLVMEREENPPGFTLHTPNGKLVLVLRPGK